MATGWLYVVKENKNKKRESEKRKKEENKFIQGWPIPYRTEPHDLADLVYCAYDTCSSFVEWTEPELSQHRGEIFLPFVRLLSAIFASQSYYKPGARGTGGRRTEPGPPQTDKIRLHRHAAGSGLSLGKWACAWISKFNENLRSKRLPLLPSILFFLLALSLPQSLRFVRYLFSTVHPSFSPFPGFSICLSVCLSVCLSFAVGDSHGRTTKGKKILRPGLYGDAFIRRN